MKDVVDRRPEPAHEFYLAGKLGERHFDERISIADDPLDPSGLPKQFDFEGIPKQRVPLVENGVLRDAVWDSASAARSTSSVQRLNTFRQI